MVPHRHRASPPAAARVLGVGLVLAGVGLAARGEVASEPAPMPLAPAAVAPAHPLPLPPVDDSFLPASVIEPLDALDPGGTEGNDGLPPPRSRTRGKPARPAPVSLGAFWAPAAAASGQPGGVALNAQFARVGVPLVRPVEGEPLWLAIGKFGRLELAGDLVLPDSGTPLPDQLWLVETGVTHIRPLASGATVGGTVLVGSASDRPFAALRDMTALAVLFATLPAAAESDEWNVSLFYSPTSQLPYPLPGLAYVWRPSATVEAKLGLPFGLEWTPDDDWSLSLGYTPLVNAQAILRRRLGAGFSAVALYRTDTEIYFLAERAAAAERFYVFNQRVAVGLERAMARGFALEMTADYLFDRLLFQGTSFLSGRTDVVPLAPGPGLSVQLSWRR